MSQKSKAPVDHRLTIRYAILQVFYWMAFSSIFTYAAVYLHDHGFDNQQVGITLALGYLTAMIIQPVAAAFVDRSETISLNQFCALTSSVLLAAVLTLMALPKVFPVMVVLFVLIEMLILLLQPLLYSLSLNFINQGIAVNFGLARGLGSGSFALTSLLVGIAIARFGTSVVLVTCAASTMLVIVFILNFKAEQPITETISEIAHRPVSQKPLPENTLQFLAHYPGFPLFLVGLVLILTNQQMFSNYQINIIEHIGGTSKILGMAAAIAAITEIPVMGYFSFFVRKVSARKLLLISAAFFIVKALATLLAANVGQFLFSQIFQAGSYAIYLPASVYYVNSIMHSGDTVKGQAFLGVTFTMGGIIGSLLGGFLLDATSVPVTLIAGLGMTVLGAILVYVGTRRKDQTTMVENQ